MKTAIMTDTNSGISSAEAESLGAFVQAMPVILDGKNYLEGIDVTHKDVFHAMHNRKEVSTSQPSVGLIMEQWDKIFKMGYDEIVYMPMSSGLSGSCASATAVAEDYNGKVQVADLRRISVTLRESVMDGLYMAEQGMSALDIRQRLEKNAGNSVIYLAVDTLEYLKKSGRVSASTATIATVLNIKPVLVNMGDKFESFAKPRGMKNAKQKIVDAVQDDLQNRLKHISYEKIRISTAGSFETEEEAKEWQNQIQTMFPEFEIRYDALSCSVVCHTGIGSAGLGISVIDR